MFATRPNMPTRSQDEYSELFPSSSPAQPASQPPASHSPSTPFGKGGNTLPTMSPAVWSSVDAAKPKDSMGGLGSTPASEYTLLFGRPNAPAAGGQSPSAPASMQGFGATQTFQ